MKMSQKESKYFIQEYEKIKHLIPNESIMNNYRNHSESSSHEDMGKCMELISLICVSKHNIKFKAS